MPLPGARSTRTQECGAPENRTKTTWRTRGTWKKRGELGRPKMDVVARGYLGCGCGFDSIHPQCNAFYFCLCATCTSVPCPRPRGIDAIPEIPSFHPHKWTTCFADFLSGAHDCNTTDHSLMQQCARQCRRTHRKHVTTNPLTVTKMSKHPTNTRFTPNW